MGEVHIWERDTRATIADRDIVTTAFYLELENTDDEDDVKSFMAENQEPDFVVAPNASDSRTNTVIAANIRRILPAKSIPVAVMVHGKTRRERVDMVYWLIENNYLPMLPRFMPNAAVPSTPLTRLQLIHEMRALLDREQDWMFVCYNWKDDGPVWDYINSTGNTWELLK